MASIGRACDVCPLVSAQEVITNEHVVAMMKAAIAETEGLPLFVSISGGGLWCLCTALTPLLHCVFQEPTMTRSKLKEVVERGVVSAEPCLACAWRVPGVCLQHVCNVFSSQVIPTWNLSPIKKVGKAQVSAPLWLVDAPCGRCHTSLSPVGEAVCRHSSGRRRLI